MDPSISWIYYLEFSYIMTTIGCRIIESSLFPQILWEQTPDVPIENYHAEQYHVYLGNRQNKDDCSDVDNDRI